MHLLLMRTWVLCCPHSLGVVLSQGHGEYIFLGNTSVEEGRSVQVLMEKGVLPGTEPGRPSQSRFDSRLSEPGCQEGGPVCGAPWVAGLQVRIRQRLRRASFALSQSGRLCPLQGRPHGQRTEQQA